ncbi:MAG: pilus assembly protein CpaD [Hyphomicrobiales bacterium]|nr:pilus assembly protein CpaD [Hyphomicrobiales bacterium]MCP4999871.1 pilus assembly protein CpaD [Hyphomicrobiales bacterium]
MTYTVTVCEKQETNQPRDRRSGFSARVVIIAAGAFLAGCANVHDIEVGSIPDDYRTNHPIMVSEKENTVDVPIARGEKKLNYGRTSIVRGFAAEYRENSSGAVQIMTPVGSPNTAAASHIAGQIKKVLVSEGVPARRIRVQSYQAAAQNDAAPIRLSFMAIGAHVAQCGKWPEDLVYNTTENKHYQNFGCATQNNLAAQIANPSDLLAPRGMTPIDAQRRDIVIDNYRKNGSYATPSE